MRSNWGTLQNEFDTSELQRASLYVSTRQLNSSTYCIFLKKKHKLQLWRICFLIVKDFSMKTSDRFRNTDSQNCGSICNKPNKPIFLTKQDVAEIGNQIYLSLVNYDFIMCVRLVKLKLWPLKYTEYAFNVPALTLFCSVLGSISNQEHLCWTLTGFSRLFPCLSSNLVRLTVLHLCPYLPVCIVMQTIIYIL